MRTLFLPLTGLLLSGSLLASAAQADEPRYNQISLQTQVEQAVNHDTMQVTFYAEAQDRDPAKLAETITQRLNAGLQTARQSQNIRVSSGSRSSHPVYDEKGENIIAWRERGELNIEGSDFAAISALTGELLGDLSLGSMQFSLSADSRRETEDQLIAKASDYKIVNLNLNTQYMQPVRYRAEKLMMASDAAGSAPQVEGGQSDVSVSANGVIEVRD